MEDELLGYLCEGRLLCRACTNDVILMDRRVTTTPVYRVNVWPYSQYCHECGYVVQDAWQRADGNGGLYLFGVQSVLNDFHL
jgi:C4-type Zn-finger protein